MTERYDYDERTGLLAGQRVYRGSDTPANRLLDLTYSYLRPGTTSGRTGHLTAITDQRDHSHDRSFEYDPLGRLRCAAAGGTQGSWAQRYLYDRYGNRSHVLSQRTSYWVINLFNVTLNRAPGAGEVQTWDTPLRNAYPQGPTQFLQAAKDVAAGFFGSPEYLDKNKSNRDYVRDLYLAYLNREPDAGGWDAWTNALTNGASRASVRAGFADSVEFANRVNTICVAVAGGATTVERDGHAALSYDSQTNRINTAGWEYDAAGNQTRTQTAGSAWQRHEYDAANRLITVKSDDSQTVYASYTYGATNERLISDELGTRTYYAAEGGQVLAEYVEYGGGTVPQWAKSYVYLGGRLLSTFAPVTGGEFVEHHHPDRLGTRLVTRPADGTSFEQASLPFGTALSSESTGGTNRRFTSYDRSGATGLDYAVNRRYDPMQGRFTQVDPIGAGASDITDPQSMNLYSYCGNDPVNHTDPDGLFFKKLFRWLAKAFKWIAIAVTVAVVVLTVLAGPTLIPFIGAFKGFAWAKTALGVLNAGLAKIGAVLGKVGLGWLLNLAPGGAAAAAVGGDIAAAALGLTGLQLAGGIGAVADHLQDEETGKAKRRREKRERREARERQRNVRVRLPEGMRTEPPRGQPGVQQPQPPQLPGIDPDNPRFPDGGSRWARFKFRLALVLRGLSDHIKSSPAAIMINPEALQDAACRENPFSNLCINGPFPGCCRKRYPMS